MFPVCRTESEGCTMPQLALPPRDVDGFIEALPGFHETFSDCLTRPEPREPFFRSMVGPCSALARQSIEPRAREVEGGNMRAMQRLRSEVTWDEEQRCWTYHHLVKDDLGAPEGVVIVEESGFPKQGKDSVGVARQYGGSLGKVAHCQGGVFTADASPRGYALLDQRLCLPEAWLTDAYAARRAPCQVPPELPFHTKPQ
jgi:SRSO17 transposase